MKFKYKVGMKVKVTNPLIEKHKKFMGMVGEIVTYSNNNTQESTFMDYSFDVVPTIGVRFETNKNMIFEFLEEELDFEKPKKSYKKASQDELRLYDLPIIPDSQRANDVRYAWFDKTRPFDKTTPMFERTTYYISASDFMTNYILGNVFRAKDSKEVKKHKQKIIYHRLHSMYEKQKDWAKIQRKAFNQLRKDNFVNGTDLDSPWSLDISNKNNIFYSKFADKGYYYRFSIGTDFFFITKASIPNKDEAKGNYKAIARICQDYAIGNFFTSEKDAKRSIIFQKLKTFFTSSDFKK